MTVGRILLWSLAFFPWIDFALRLGGPRVHLPPAIARGWDEVLLSACLIAVLARRRARRIVHVPRRIVIGFVAFVAAGVVAVAVNRVPAAIAVDAFRVIYEPMLFALVVMFLLDDERLRDEFIDLAVASATAIATLALVQYALGIESPRWTNKPNVPQFRVVSIFANPNALAGYLNMVMAFSLALAAFGLGVGRRLLYAIASLVLVLALVVTFSRGAWIACAVLCIHFAATTRLERFKLVLGLVAVAVLGAVLLPTGVAGRIAQLFEPDYYRTSAIYGRLSFWTDALATMRENPFFGVGPGMFGGSVALRHGVAGATWVDNHYLKLGAELGLVGLATFLFLLSTLYVHARAACRRAKSERERAVSSALGGVIVVMAVQNATASIWEALYVGTLFYAFVGTLLALPGKPTVDGGVSG